MLDRQPLISIVITCFNYARYVGGAIECALRQSYANKQVIVVNDGSTDDSLAVIERYADRITIVDQENQGSIAAYNHGFAASRGEIVIFLDADDLLEPDALERVGRAWSPTHAKVQYDLHIIDGEGKNLGRKFCNFDHDYGVERVRESFRSTGTYRWPVTVGNAYSRWFVACIFPLSVEHGPDGTLNTLAPVYGEVATIPLPLGSYRIHDSNMWSSGGSDVDRLPRRIAHRMKEISLMQQHAQARGVAVPQVNALDHEIAFINYRLMARKLSLPYEGETADSGARLRASALTVLRAEKYPLKLTFAHALWLGALGIAPAGVAREMIRLRFRRHLLGKQLLKAVQRLSGMPASADQAMSR